jgi:enoyl-CoA hydratase/carnithine racemase
VTDDPELVHLVIDGYVATITLDSPQNRNALSRRLVEQLRGHLAAAESNPTVRVVVLTHTGGTFCAGADLAEAVEEGMERGTRALLGLLTAVVSLSKPVVALVRGHVRAGGLGLVGACDLALVSNQSTFGFAEVRLGLTPAIISLTTRTRLADRDASRLYLTGEVFKGAAASSYGLVTSSVDEMEIESALAQMLAQFAEVSPQGLRETKALLNAPVLAHIERDGERLVELSARLFASGEAREGMSAFRERRPPSWEHQRPTHE